MTLPIPPSDSLYKFTAIGGLILTILSFFIPEQMIIQHTITQIDNALEAKRIQIEGEELERQVQALNGEVRHTEGRLSEILKQIEAMKSASQSLKSKQDLAIESGLIDLQGHNNRHSNQVEGLRSRGVQIKLLAEQAKSSAQKQEYLKTQINKLNSLSWVTSIYGILLMLFGFWNWYFKFQAYQDQIIKAQAKQWTTRNPEREKEEIPG